MNQAYATLYDLQKQKGNRELIIPFFLIFLTTHQDIAPMEKCFILFKVHKGQYAII